MVKFVNLNNKAFLADAADTIEKYFKPISSMKMIEI